MQANRQLYNASFSSMLSTTGSSLTSVFTGGTNGREIGKMVALSIGAPVQFVHVANRLNPQTFIAMLYLFELEYCGRDGVASVWGEEYTAMYHTGHGVGMLSHNTEPTDVLCYALNGVRHGDSMFIFNRLLSKFKDINVLGFANYFTYLVCNGCIETTQMDTFLRDCDSGVLLKAVMDSINESKVDERVRARFNSLSESGGFAELCQSVTRKIAASVSTAS